MNCASAISKACIELNQAIQDGYLVNQSMVGFIFCGALTRYLPSAQIVYDGRPIQNDEATRNMRRPQTLVRKKATRLSKYLEFEVGH